MTEDNPVRVVDVFIDELDLEALGFSGVAPEVTGRPAYHPATLLKIYLYGYDNRIQAEPAARTGRSQRNIELMWLTGRLMPDFPTDDRRLPPRDSGPAIRAACAVLSWLMPSVATFHADYRCDRTGASSRRVNNRDKNSSQAKVAKRIDTGGGQHRALPWGALGRVPSREDGDDTRLQDNPRLEGRKTRSACGGRCSPSGRSGKAG